MQISANIVGYSENEYGDRLLSVIVVMPKYLIAELNTHRAFSRNTSSSRAIPAKKMQASVLQDEFNPIAWMKAHSGMQGTDYFNVDSTQYREAVSEWNKARANAVESARVMNDIGITKQMTNRIIEPFMWATVLITSGMEGWNNFFEQRCSKYIDIRGNEYLSKEDYQNVHGKNGRDKLDWLRINKGTAEIHMRELAECIYSEMKKTEPKKLKEGEWHLPMYNPDICDNQPISKVVRYLCAVHANTSYTVVGDQKEMSMDKGLEIFEKLVNANPIHYSPLEHCAVNMTRYERELFSRRYITGSDGTIVTERGWCNNFRGFIQLRYMLSSGYDPYRIFK